MLTVDVPLIGKRERDLRNGMMIPPRIGPAQALEAVRRPRWLWHLAAGPPVHFGCLLDLVPPNTNMASMGAYMDRELSDLSKTWQDVAWLRERWDGPLLIKGVMSAADARRCVEQGADAVIVSNHGGRQLDGLPAALDVLGEVVAEVGGDAEVILDGGIRRGADLVKARALGATAAMGGRAWFWALAAGGEAGVTRMLEILRGDVDRTLALLGRNSYEDLDAGHPPLAAPRWLGPRCRGAALPRCTGESRRSPAPRRLALGGFMYLGGAAGGAPATSEWPPAPAPGIPTLPLGRESGRGSRSLLSTLMVSPPGFRAFWRSGMIDGSDRIAGGSPDRGVRRSGITPRAAWPR